MESKAKIMGHPILIPFPLGLLTASVVFLITGGVPGAVAIVLSFAGVGLASIGGSLGGELVVCMGAGVSEGANLNAPSSLSGSPAGGGSIGCNRKSLKAYERSSER